MFTQKRGQKPSDFDLSSWQYSGTTTCSSVRICPVFFSVWKRAKTNSAPQLIKKRKKVGCSRLHLRFRLRYKDAWSTTTTCCRLSPRGTIRARVYPTFVNTQRSTANNLPHFIEFVRQPQSPITPLLITAQRHLATPGKGWGWGNAFQSLDKGWINPKNISPGFLSFYINAVTAWLKKCFCPVDLLYVLLFRLMHIAMFLPSGRFIQGYLKLRKSLPTFFWVDVEEAKSVNEEALLYVWGNFSLRA